MSKFLDAFRKKASKVDGVDLVMHTPSFFLDSGNFVINKLLYGHYDKCFPQGRLSAIGGPSSTGKTYVASNCAKYALEAGVGVLYIDTENAIDEGHFDAIGIDPEHPLLQYSAVSSIAQCIEIVSMFMKTYRDSGETIPFLIVIDSLDMLQTESEETNYAKGEIKGAQGQKQLQLKRMLTAFVHDVKTVPMHILCTKQVYVNQDDATKLIEPWKFTESLKFAFSQILLVTKLTLRDETTKEYSGFKLKAFGFKTRFTKPFQTAEIEVPYDSGMDRYTGLLSGAAALGIVKAPPKGDSWYTYGVEKFQKKGFSKYQDEILKLMIEREDQSLNVQVEGEEESGETEEAATSTKPIDVVKKKFGKKANESNP